MNPTIKTDPFTGVSVGAMVHDNGDMTVELPFIGLVTLVYDPEKDSFAVPSALFEQRPCISATQAAKVLGVSRQRVNVLCNDGTLMCAKVNGNMLVDQSSLLAYKETRQ